jgi:ribosomal protein S27AE
MAGEEASGGGRASVRPWTIRRALGPLLAYHVLVLVGGVLVVEGVLQGSDLERDLGVVTLIAGVATALGVLRWTAKLARGSRYSRPAGAATSAPSRTCPRCGRAGQDGRTVCEQCGSALVWSVRSS